MFLFVAVSWQYWRRQWHPTPVLLPGKSHGRRSLVGCSPWGREESDMTERFHFHFSLLCIGEGNGNPLQCSCLEDPRDGITQSRTRLKWLSSSSTHLRSLSKKSMGGARGDCGIHSGFSKKAISFSLFFTILCRKRSKRERYFDSFSNFHKTTKHFVFLLWKGYI